MNESAKLRACVLACFACSRALRVYVLGVLTCLACLRAWCACVHACVVVTMKCFIFLRVCALGVWCAFLSYLLYISILLKILRANKLCALLS